MATINRFGFGGVYVMYSDHESEMARVRAEADGLRSFVAEYISAYRNGYDGDDYLLNLAKSLLVSTVGCQDVE